MKGHSRRSGNVIAGTNPNSDLVPSMKGHSRRSGNPKATHLINPKENPQ